MDAFAPLLLIALILDSVIESAKLIGKMVKERKVYIENVVAFGVGYAIFATSHINLLSLSGLPGDSDLFFVVSYFTAALIGMRGSAAIHDLYKAIQTFRNLMPSNSNGN